MGALRRRVMALRLGAGHPAAPARGIATVTVSRTLHQGVDRAGRWQDHSSECGIRRNCSMLSGCCECKVGAAYKLFGSVSEIGLI